MFSKNLCILGPLLLSTVASFVPRSARPVASSRLQDSLKEPAFGMEDYDAARQTFERLHFDDSRGTLKAGPLPMTSNVQRLRRMEVKLLEALKDSDQAIDPLVELWVKERRDASEALHYMIQSENPDLYQEEMALRQMMQDYEEDGWVEPHGRLAVLLFMRGELWEALDLCDFVLWVKPWHFEVAQLLVVIFLRLGDMGRALDVRRNCVLPHLQHPKSRQKWVERMSRLARERLDHAEEISATATLDVSVTEECPVGDDDQCWQ